MSYNNNNNSKWNPELCIILINEYKNKPVLWDTQHEFHYNKCKKQEAWEDIANNLSIDVEKIKNKINSILAAFRRERTKFRKAHLEKPYMSQWYAFNALHFLLNDDDINKLKLIQKNIENLKRHENGDVSIIESLNDPLNSFDENDEQMEMIEHSENKDYKMNEIENIEINNFFYENHEQEYTIIGDGNNEDNSTIWKEECNAFGQYIANKLYQYDLRTRSIAEHAISNIIFEADIGKFNNETSSSSSNNLLLSYANLEQIWLKRNNNN